MSDICEIVREAENDYVSGSTVISKHVSFSLRENVEKIEAYKYSKHISGDVDSLGREKPFFNIVTAAANTWYRATDIDRKNIVVRATKESDYVASLLASIKLQESFRKNNFGIFLNNWGKTLAEYGTAVSKHVEKDGQLISTVVPWNRLIVDAVNIEASPIIEKLYMTPSQLRRNKAYDQEVVERIIEAKVARKTLGGEQVDTKSDYIEVYEVHGVLEEEYLTGEEKNETEKENYVQQVHIVCFNQTETGEYDDYTLYKGREAKSPYYVTSLMEEDGRVMGIGAIERLFEAQWMKNHSVKAIKDYLDIAAKVFFQTSDGNFVGQNVLTNLENGDVMIHGPNAPITAVNNYSNGFQAMQSFGQEWEGQANKTAGISEAMMGEQKSGTAWRQTEALLQESHSLFELMTENKALALEEIIKIYFIPFIKKQLDSKEEITATLSDYGVKEIEKLYIKNQSVIESNKKNLEMLLDTEAPMVPTTPEEQMQGVQESLTTTGTQRFFTPDEIGIKTWKEVMDGLEWKLEIDISNEQRDTQAAMTTLNTLYMSLVQNPAQADAAKLVLSKILEETGVVSPVEIQALESSQQSAQQLQQSPLQPQNQTAPIGGA